MYRLYNGRISLDTLQKDLSYTFKRWSWAGLNTGTTRLNGPHLDVEITVFNSSSFASQSLARRIRHSASGQLPNAW